jgi:predicted dehydrogenase
LRQIDGVELVVVCNRSRESSAAVAAEFGFAKVETKWQALVERPDLDAVMIGTWPYMHCEMSTAALAAGKHVFCQARMAMDLDQARRMHDAARARPGQVAVICPPPHRMPFEPFIRKVIADGDLGEIRLVELVSRSGANLGALTWREQVEYSGKQALLMGIYAETLNAWVGLYRQLAAHTAAPVAAKPGPQGGEVNIAIPQVLTITGELAGGATAIEQHFGLAADSTTPCEQLTLYGSAGTLRHRFLTDTVEMARPGEALQPVDVPPEGRRPWRVEADFIDAVRAARAGNAWTGGHSPDFAEGLEYMRKVEAVHEAAATGKTVDPSTL